MLAHLGFVVYADDLLHSQHSEPKPFNFIAELVKDLFDGNIDIIVPGLSELKDLWDQASDWLKQAKTQSAEEALPPKNMWVLAMAYLVENYHQQPANAEFLKAKLKMEKTCGRLGSKAKIDELAVALGLPFYLDESLITSEPEEHRRPVQSDNDGDGRRAQDAVSACQISGEHACQASCPLACHKKHHDSHGGCCWHFVIYWQLVPNRDTDKCIVWARKVFSAKRFPRFKNMLDMAKANTPKEAFILWTLRKNAIQRMLSMYWPEIAKWIDESVASGLARAQQWGTFEKYGDRKIEMCEPLRGAVKAFGTAGSAVLRDVAIDA